MVLFKNRLHCVLGITLPPRDANVFLFSLQPRALAWDVKKIVVVGVRCDVGRDG